MYEVAWAIGLRVADEVLNNRHLPDLWLSGRKGVQPKHSHCAKRTQAQLLFGISYPLPNFQTVPRGELSALVTLAEFATFNASLTYITDSKYLFDMYNKGEIICTSSTNHDLYILLFKYIKTRQLNLEVKWMPSHIRTDPKKAKIRPAWVEDHNIDGNDDADKLADKAELRCRVDRNKSNPYYRNVRLVYRIQNRISTIMCNLPNRKKIPRTSIPTTRIATTPLIDRTIGAHHY